MSHTACEALAIETGGRQGWQGLIQRIEYEQSGVSHSSVEREDLPYHVHGDDAMNKLGQGG